MTNSNDVKPMARLLIFLGVIGAFGYWYWWYGPHLDSQIEAGRLWPLPLSCNAVSRTSGLSGQPKTVWQLPRRAGAAERDCAEMHSLYLRDGKWHRKEDP